MNFDIEKITNKLLIKYPGFATIIANMQYIPSYNCKSNGNPTAGCDGKNFIYHPDFMANLTENQQLFIAAHEVFHIALDHIYRSDGKDPEIWNIATDAVINAFLKQAGLELVDGGVDMEGAEKYDAEELYNKLLEEKKNSNNNDKSNQNNSNNENSDSQSNNTNTNENNLDNQSDNSQENSGNDNPKEEYKDVGHDTHSMWNDAVKKHKEKLEKGTQNSELEKEQKNNSNLGEKEVFRRNEELKKENLKKLKQNLIKQAAGTGTSSSYFRINDIGEGSLINWQTLLKNTSKINIDWTYVDATIEDGVVTPHLQTLPTPETEILLDTSGSISEDLLKNFLRECKCIYKTAHIKVGCFDTRFYGFTEIKRDSDIENMVFQGGGGTNFDSAINAFTKRVDNRIIFTDGYAPMPKDALDVIWIVFGDTKIEPKGGKVIYISGEEFNKLSCLNGKRR